MYKILIVDDDADVRRLVKKVLEQAGHSVVIVDNGLSALNEINNGAFDLLISDASMPQYSGFDLIKAVRRQPRHKDLLIAMLTGRREKQAIEQAIDLGVQDYIVKPIDPQLFLVKIQKILESKDREVSLFTNNDTAFVNFSATLQSPLKMVSIGLHRFAAVSPTPFPVGMELYLNIDELEYSNLPRMRVLTCQPHASEGHLVEGEFVDADEDFKNEIIRCLNKYKAA